MQATNLHWLDNLVRVIDRTHHRHELDLSSEEKVCNCCGRSNDRIGEDISKVLGHVPAKLESYLAALTDRGLPKSALAKAVKYARNQWDALR